MIKEVVIWAFIIVFILTAIVTLLGLIKNFKLIEVEDKYLKILLKTLIVEVVVVIIGFGASSFKEESQETTYKKEIENYKLETNKLVEKLNIDLAKVRKEKKDKSAEIFQIKKEIKNYKSIIDKNNGLVDELNINFKNLKNEIEVKSILISKMTEELELKTIKISRLIKEKNEISYILSEIKKTDEETKNKEYKFEDAKADFNSKVVYFLADTDDIASTSMELLDLAIKKLGGYKNIKIRLQPITPLNQALGLITKRQESIRAYLVTKGFIPHNIVIVTDSRYGNDSDEVYNADNILLEKGMLLILELKDA